LYVFNNNKNTTLERAQKHRKIKNHKKQVFLNFYKKTKTFFTSMIKIGMTGE